MPRPDVSIIIPCFNKVDYTIRCLTSLAEHTPGDRYEVVIVDNASSDATPDLCAGLEGDVITIRNDENLGFSRACNQGAEAARGRHLLFLNNDTEALAGWLEPLLAVIEAEPDVGAVGSRLLFPDDTLQHAGVLTHEDEGVNAVAATHQYYRHPRDHPPATVRRDLDVVTGACVLFRREAFEMAGGFDEGYWNGFEDVDLCLLLREAGWRVVYEPASVLYHHESVSGPERFRKADQNVARLNERWEGRYVPQWMRTATGAHRPHPGRARVEVVITGHASRRRDVSRSIEAARKAIRGTDSICVDATLLADGVAELVVEDGTTRIGIPDPAADFHLEIHAGVLLHRETIDRLLAMTVYDAATAGPVLPGAAGPQAVSTWLGPDAPAGAGSRRKALAHSRTKLLRVDELDPRCVLRRRTGPPATIAAVAVSSAYADDVASRVTTGARR